MDGGRVAADLPGMLVGPSWLEERLGRSGLAVVDLRDADAHARGHIPGAAHLELAALGSSARGMDNVLLPADAFSRLIAGCGISNRDVVVAYDDQWGLAAARLVWALHRYGHETAAVLDGGWDAWLADGRAVAEGAERVTPGQFAAVPSDDVYVDREGVSRRTSAGDAVLLDTRSPSEFAEGHIPGAVSWDWLNAVPADSWSASRDPEELRAEWRALGLDVSKEIIVYCRSGMRAAHTYVALRNAGFERVRLYDGSWQEWSMKTDEARG